MSALPLPAWPEETTPEGLTFFGNAAAIFAAWRAHGAPNAFALGMLAQAEAESSLDPNAKGDHVKGEPTAFGLHQWHASRLAAIRAQHGADILADVKAGRGSVQTQIDAAAWELDTFAYYGKKAIASASTAYGAAAQACALFERAGAANAAARRGAMAERWAVYFQKKGF